MDKLASQTKEKLEWRKSIVDLMKLLNLDRSLAARTADNKITELRADIGGVLGLGQREIALPAGRFSLQNDRVVLELTAAQAKDLPKVAK
jgi:uncharacterized protein DUF3597